MYPCTTMGDRHRSKGWLVCLLLLPLSACSTMTASPKADVAEVTLEAPAPQVRAAMVRVLEDDRYVVEQADGATTTLTTGFRNDIDGPWNWLLTSRFGKGRSRVEVLIQPRDDAATHVVIRIVFEGKDSLFASWQAYVPPLPQNAENQVRLVKHALGLL